VRLGLGIGWRPEIELTVARLPGVEWVEIVAENISPDAVPASLAALSEFGMPVIPHGVSLSLGGTEPPDSERLARLAGLAERFGSPLVSEHVAFCRADGIEAGHLLPVPRTRAAVDVLTENITIAQAALPVPLAVENIAPLLSWPEDELNEAEFLTELVERTGVLLLLDVANMHTAHVNFGLDPIATLDALPLDRIGYVHVAGGVLHDGIWHDTHAHTVSQEILSILAALAERAPLPGVMLERDEAYPSGTELAAEIATIRQVLADVREHTDPAWQRPASVAETGRHANRTGKERAPQAGPTANDTLAARQMSLVRALVAGGYPPAGVDPERVRVQALALLRKRFRSVARYRPELVAALGANFWPTFQQYAAAEPTPSPSTSHDTERFARYMRKNRDSLPQPDVQ
jgi:uncharacterized protein (UPF0276 family)